MAAIVWVTFTMGGDPVTLELHQIVGVRKTQEKFTIIYTTEGSFAVDQSYEQVLKDLLEACK